jgi:acyl carrier protein
MNADEARALAAAILAGIAPEADLGTVGDDEDLRAALDLDSMDFMNFVIGLSERAGVNIPEADTPRLRTLQGVARYLADVAPRPRAS